MSRIIRVFALAGVVVLLSHVAEFPGAPRTRATVEQASISAEVVDAIDADGSARVIIELNEAPMRPTETSDRGPLRRRIARAQQSVIDGLAGTQLDVTRRYGALPALAAEIDVAALDRLARHPGVASVTLDVPVNGALPESVPLINADDVRNALGYTGEGVIVAVLDTGVDNDHPDFIGDIAYERCFLVFSTCPGGATQASGPGSAEADHFHGANVAGIITSAGVVAPIGVAPDAQIAAYKVLDSNNLGWPSDWIAALDDIIDFHPEVDVVNMSLTDNQFYPGTCDLAQPTATTAINTLRSLGVPTFVATGNNAYITAITWPSCIANAIAVGAVYDATIGASFNFHGNCTESPIADQVACWSNSSSTLDVLAPGAVTLSAGLAGGTSAGAGTSMASPHAAGVAALMLEANPALTVTEIETAMETTGVPRLDTRNGLTRPRIDAYAAVVEVTDPDNDNVPNILDNCQFVANPGQENNDRNFINLAPDKAYNDLTWPASDESGDACDADDDNDGRSDADELAGAGGCAVTNPLLRDSDGDRMLDSAECALGTNPHVINVAPAACTAPGDADSDGLVDAREFCYYGTSSASTNSDGDLCSDAKEVASINADTAVTAIDLSQVAQAFGAYVLPNAAFRLNFDVTKDGTINAIDLSQIAQRFGPC